MQNSSLIDESCNHIPDIVPPNEAIPVKCYQQKDGNLMAEFVTRTSGVFKIEVMDNGRPIVGSPFQCLSYDPARVRLLGIARYQHLATINGFAIQVVGRASN